MTSFTSSDPLGGRPEKVARRRRRFPTVSGVHLLILTAGGLAFIANLALLSGGGPERIQVASSRVDLTPGRRLQPEDIRLTPVDVEESVASGLISESDMAAYRGWVVTGKMASGSLLHKANLRSPLAESGSRAMSFPIGVEHAVGGDLVSGDLVDVIRVDEDRARFIATGLAVLDVSGRTEGGLGLSGDFYLVLEVDDRTALALALALAHARVEVLRSTGSKPVTVRSLDEFRSDPRSSGGFSAGQGPSGIRPGSSGGGPDGEGSPP